MEEKDQLRGPDIDLRQQISTRGLRRVVAAVALLACAIFRQPAEAALQTATASIEPASIKPASIEIDAGKVEGRLSPLLYGQFAEFMFENIKGGLHAEMIRNRGFEEAPNATGLSRYWERYPDDRNDDYGLSFGWDEVKSDPLARLAILFRGQGRLWVDQVSLMPGDAVDGVRADVFEKVKALRPAFIRWPGGNVAQDYHWQWGVGPRDEIKAGNNFVIELPRHSVSVITLSVDR
jgi:hypothetical protein